ncbi:hypothetical protein IWZ03DRAFT_222115 [Phyllosticta citriasiana]|uniref:Cytochrome b561 domain-containing protein n=1 Tax=Phyllosticta citriasiana TaxID=595635 RepID=A0ABR1KLV5_9PEZI
MSNNGLSRPGSSTYSSNTMYVGDGTWDSERNTFLLPNLMGLNFDTMRYNGMGNRFRELSGYKSLVTGHAVVAAITFLAVVPAAIFFARFYHRNPRLALRMHIWLQILTVLLTTVVFTLGWFAVGGARSLTNPHHGIGLAIYVLVLVQAIGGALIHRAEKGRERLKIPLKLMMHQWMGRAIALLGFVQVPLGLTLYGSPAYLFVLYALWGAFLLLLYFILTYRNLPVGAFDDDGTYISYVTESTDDGRSRRSRLGALATAGAAGAGLAALRRRSKSRKRQREAESAMEREDMRERQRSRSRDRRAAASGRSSSYLEEEKFYDEPPKQHTWRNRLITGAAALGAIAAVKNIFGKKKTPEESDVGSGYSYPSQGPHRVSQTDISRVEEGRVPASPMTPGDRYRRIQESEVAVGSAVTGSLPPRRPHARTRRSGGSIDSYDSRDSLDYIEETEVRPGTGAGEEKSHKARNGLLALGLIGFIKHKMNQRRDRKEEDRVARLREEEVEQERLARADSQRRKYTGDGFEPYTPTSPRSRRGSRRISSSHSVDNHLVHHGSNPELARQTYPPRPPPQQAGTSTTGMMTSRIDTVGEGSHPSTGFVPPPGGAAPHDPLPMGRGGPLGPAARINDSTSYSSSSLTSPTRDAASRRHGGRKRRSAAALAGTGAAIGAAALASRASRSHSRTDSRSRSRSGGRRRRQELQDDPLSSPPVSVKVKMHKDGRHVTLRRLNEQEAAEEREARRRERRGESVGGGGGGAGKSSTGRSRRASTLSDVSGSEDRWRRRSAAMASGGAGGVSDEMDIKARAAAIAKEIDIEHEAANLPPPPPGPHPPPHQQQQAPQYPAPYPMPGPPPGPPPPPQQQQPPYQYPQQGLQPPHTPFNNPPANPKPKPFNDSSMSPPHMPPPGMGSAMGVGSGMGSPYETGPSDMSANYDSNRRRRRMERAAQAARGRGSGSKVEFT